ncbi:uncharacterized protein LOC129790837 [Lutzomyia longipalpis]|uniref:uncharacterized protein LOC129790837 n=1 Tax=Lutzomyia longipalpis TaxID=7200 RepID=UPI0024844C61|nr:uncharacterized protein LOC129790837 [Lutzomyia longipalpis]XP_055684591.1 uncharacterized protein LOC129790837 [Lutzomyia longipalpis]
MDTKFEQRQYQGQIPSSFPETFKDFFSMLNEDEDHVELISNILEDKVIPRSKCRFRCGSSRCCHNLPTGPAAQGSGDIFQRTRTLSMSNSSAMRMSTGMNSSNFGRSSSFRVARPTAPATDYCKHMKYCCLHQNQTHRNFHPTRPVQPRLDFGTLTSTSSDEEKFTGTGKKLPKLYGNVIQAANQDTKRNAPPLYESCDESEAVSSSCSSSNNNSSTPGGYSVSTRPSPMSGGPHGRGSITRATSGLPPTPMSEASHFLLPNLQQATPGTPTSSATTPSAPPGSHPGPPTPGSGLNSPATKTFGEKNSHKLPDIKSQKSPVFNRRRSSSVTLAQPPSDLHRFSSVRGTEDVTAWRGDPGGGSGNSTGYSRERYCKSPVNRPPPDCGTPSTSQRPTKQKQRMRTASMPAENRKPRLSELRRSAIHCADVDIEYYRLRSFSITSHGICNLGDSMRSRRSRSINSVTSSNSGRDRHNSNASQTTTNDLAMDTEQGDGTTAYKVAMLGASGVGKTALTYQFTTSEYICAYDLSLDDDYGQKTVSVLLDGQETDLEIIDHPACEMSTEAFCSTYNIDIFVVVYSVVDRKTFKAAEKVLHYLKDNEMLLTRGAILVGNKTDLERHREVPTQAGRRLAKDVSCKFIETSSGLDHNVDELLVGIVAQVKLNPQRLCNLTEEQKQGLRMSGIPGCSAMVAKTKEEEAEATKQARKRQMAHSSGPLNAMDLHTLKNSFENKENIPRRTRNRQRQHTPQKSGLNEEDEDNKSTSSSVSSSNSSSIDENEVNLLSQGSTSCSSTPTKNPIACDTPKSGKKKNLAAEKAVARFSNRTKLFLTSFLKFKKNLRVKRRNSNSCSDLFVI